MINCMLCVFYQSGKKKLRKSLIIKKATKETFYIIISGGTVRLHMMLLKPSFKKLT